MVDENEFAWGDKVYAAQKIVGDDYCGMCKLKDIEDACDKALCLPTQRKDRSNVIFVEKEEEEQLDNRTNNTKEKKEEFKLTDNMKFWCDGKRYGAKVQEKLFELGYKWIDGFKVWHPAVGGKYTLYARQNRLTWGFALDFEENTKCVAYILDETTGEIVPVDKETQEDKSINVDEPTNNTKTESLDSLFNQIVLMQKENDSLVEQKEQLVNKISANTQAINILKGQMQLCLNRIGNVFVEADKADIDEEEGILDITDWRDLKVGDVVEITSVHKGTFSEGYEKFIGAAATVLCVDDPEYQNLEVLAINTRLWIDGFKFVSRPNK